MFAHSAEMKSAALRDHGGYIPGLDGLRALAVTAVIVYHIAPGYVRGGFLGVDIFFAISGFLITTLLLRERRRYGHVNLPNFWLRRARRLIPALITVTLVVVPLALIVHRDLLVGIGRQVLGALTFSTNWLEIAHGSDYFDSTAPLLFKNFWSLAIEEQFYLVWPAVFLLLIHAFKTWRPRACIVIFVAFLSALLMAVWFDPQNLTRLYYGTDTHVFGLALGISLAFSYGSRTAGMLGWRFWRVYGRALGWLCLVGLVAMIVLVPDTSAYAYRGGMLCASLLAVGVIATLIYPGSSLSRVMDGAVLRWIGTRSYGLYLWHWPLLVLAQLLVPVPAQSWHYYVHSAITIVLVCIVCEVSYRLIETPVRKYGYRRIFQRIKRGILRETRPKLYALGVAVLLGLTIAAIVVAPEKTQTQLMIEANQQAIKDSQARAQDPAHTEKPAQRHKEEPEESPKESLEQVKKPSASGLSPTLDTSDPAFTDITVIGDSMVSASATGITYAMPGSILLGEPNRQWGAAHDVIAQGLANNQIGRVAILVFGTNAGVSDPELVRSAIEQLGADRVVMLVNLYSPSAFVPDSNAAYQQIADEYPNVGLIDWNAVASKDPGGLLQADSTHTSILGANTFGELLRDDTMRFFAELRNEGK